MNLPTGTVTFLFTDIEGSTKILETLGNDYKGLLEDHHRLLRAAWNSEQGIEIATEGDSFFVVFTSAPAAVRAAIEAQRSLAEHGWPEGIEVRVRMGLHTGEGRHMGDSYGGIDVHRAARIASSAHGGQVVLSEATKNLVGNDRGETRFVDLGVHRLKDLESPERIYQLCVDGLPSEFPALKSLDARPNNLPHDIGHFVHREREQTDIEQLLSAHRLVTLTGPGGTGKTRLSLRIASDSLPDFTDGCFFVQLASVTESGLVAPTIAATVGAREAGTQPIEEALHEFLAGKEMLLVLDNFEQITAAAPVVVDILQAAPAVKVLVTSRAPLGVYGEQQYPVPPMEIGGPGLSLEQLADIEAIALFVQRAKSLDPSFELSAENATLVSEICARVDGLPLAIELAASRIRLLSVKDIHSRLEKSLSLLTGGPDDLPDRQRTLKGAILWSYELLEERARSFFIRLGVFEGGWSLEATEQVLRDEEEPEHEVLLELQTLLENNLIRRFETDIGDTRFRMLQTIREFALEELHSSGRSEDTKRRHAAFFCELAERTGRNLTKDESLADILDQEHDNFRAALRWALDRGDIDIGLTTATELWRFWQVRGYLGEGRRWLTDLLQRSSERSTTRARALSALGSLAYWQNDYEPSMRYYTEALAIFKEVGDSAGTTEQIYNLGFLALIERRLDEAWRMFREALAMYEKAVDEHGVASANWGMAMTAITRGEVPTARHHAEVVLEIFGRLGDWFGKSLGEYVLLLIARHQGDHRGVRDAVLGQLESAERSGDLAGSTAPINLLADSELLQGNLERAVRLSGAAESLRVKAGGGAPPPLLMISGPPRELTRGRLPDDVIESTWQEGLSMSPDEVLAYVRKAPGEEDAG